MTEKTPLQVAINTDYEADVDAETRIRLCAAAGFTHVHWCEDFGNRNLYDDAFIERLGSLLTELGISLLDLHNPGPADMDIRSDDPDVRERGIAVFRNRIIATRKLGSDCLVTHLVEAGSPGFANTFGALDRITAFCGEQDVKLAVEASSAAGADPYFERYPPEVMGYCYDIGHCNKRTPPTLQLLEKYAERLCVTHLHDNYGKEDDHRLPFDGTVPWPRMAATLRRMDYAKPLCVEVGRKTYMTGQYSAAEKQMTREEFLTEAHKRIVEIATCTGRAAHDSDHPGP